MKAILCHQLYCQSTNCQSRYYISKALGLITLSAIANRLRIFITMLLQCFWNSWSSFWWSARDAGMGCWGLPSWNSARLNALGDLSLGICNHQWRNFSLFEITHLPRISFRTILGKMYIYLLFDFLHLKSRSAFQTSHGSKHVYQHCLFLFRISWLTFSVILQSCFSSTGDEKNNFDFV